MNSVISGYGPGIRKRSTFNFRGDRGRKRDLQTKYVSARKTFDKALRHAERQYHATKREHINQLRTDDPRHFWEEINKLGL